ncbi:cation-translocating P-type ATPase [Prevotella sp. kh1p2]|uniref:cation-translocating P-type ATPase n=1 Tax=Prevotella sp. kh1p2 TaxID=1761883 RepID=UPI0008B40918|nr:cation-translocating P-type ATPase [Prevotella sp. kh1p2]SES68454.1 Ca2+-transporting ATPase [Prevotella sp. kh1p2]
MVADTTKDIDITQGLSGQEVLERRLKYGENLLTPPPRTSLWKLYLDKYRDPIIRILLVAAAISLVLAFVENDFIETIGIFLAIFFATTVGFYFERDAAKKFNILNALGEEQLVKVRREGRVCEIPRKDVVVGDVILIEVGDEIPADGKLVHAVDLQIDESSLTGEPICAKSVDNRREHDESTYPRDMVLRSTMVMSGRGEAVVTAVGDHTEIGKVARKSTEVTPTKTPLNTQLDKLAKLISKIGSAVAIAAFVIFLAHDILTNHAVWQGTDYFKMAEVVLNYFMMAVTLIVMAVPEGLPMAVTLSLALNMRRMLKSNNLVRKLHACETMGAVTVICTDKTGTLTQNKMQVGEMMIAHGDNSLMATAIAANSTAELADGHGIGNPTEASLLLWVQQQGFDYRSLRREATVLEQQPFSTEKKMMATRCLFRGREYRFVKGAPEIVMDMCNMEPEARRQADAQLATYQHKAMRTLAFACNGTFQGFAAISDPIREDVPQAVQQCQRAGIEVKIVTGDTSATAVEIGRQAHLFDDMPSSITQHPTPITQHPTPNTQRPTPNPHLITGPEWAALTDEEAYERAPQIRVMSRARPTDKQRLVEMLQKRGEIVAVTGDGTNDAPALHYAHVGLSLGSGTSVAKEASDMTLLDDSFGSIANAVMWGRSLYKNIQRFLFFQLVVNVTALLLVLGGSVIGTEMPLTVTQILWVNLIMDTFAALALASLPPSRDVMNEKPRSQADFILTPGMSRGILFCGISFFLIMFAYLYKCLHDDDPGMQSYELTMFFTTFVMLQFWNLFNAKTLGSDRSAFRHFVLDKGLMLVLVLILCGQWLIVTFGGKMFRTVPLTAESWLKIIVATSAVLWAGEIWRWIRRLLRKRKETQN